MRSSDWSSDVCSSDLTTLPYLADVARIERAWIEAYHAAEAPALDPAALARFTPDELPALRLRLHPSVRLVRSRFPAMTIWRMNVGDGVPAPVDLKLGIASCRERDCQYV